ncbi:DNA repair protein RecO [Lutimonas saemankumensis]|uniref:DNA repair protein RecO n=1 Tax=Lutimonas saemankumensis TaxID=483016 RepID=UPI001CD6467D|nr:DNA repair protein RecO [Lutimonas saemankumensis]MCA0932943.1 DNA repair protein RecO [Lutimonas saemankumensis]
MQIKTKAIVLTSIKYGEADLIVKCLTEEGVKSYLIRSIFRSKSKKLQIGYFQPLSQLEISAFHNNKGNLNKMSEARVSYLYTSIGSNVYKQSIALFLSECLAYALREEERNPALFEYIETSFKWLDQHDSYANFHLIFLWYLSKFLGIFPDLEGNNNNYFNLDEGSFNELKPLGNYLSGDKLILFKSIIGIKFDDMQGLKWSSESRNQVLEIVLKYYELHLPGFKKPRSLKVLKEVFNEVS